MSKLQGLAFLQKQFDFNANQMGHLLLYKNIPPEKLNTYQVGMAQMMLLAKECGDVLYALRLMRSECAHGLAGTIPEEYDPSVDLDGELLSEARPYDVYAELGYYLRPDDTPYGLGLDVSPELLNSIGYLLIAGRESRALATARGEWLLQRESDEEDFRPMTDKEMAQYTRKQETELMEGCAFTVGFNDDMARLRQLVAERGDLNEILELIGPLPEAPF